MNLTESAKARIMLEGAIARHAPRNHLRKQYVLATAMEIKADTKRREKDRAPQLPLFASPSFNNKG